MLRGLLYFYDLISNSKYSKNNKYYILVLYLIIQMQELSDNILCNEQRQTGCGGFVQYLSLQLTVLCSLCGK